MCVILENIYGFVAAEHQLRTTAAGSMLQLSVSVSLSSFSWPYQKINKHFGMDDIQSHCCIVDAELLIC